MTVVWTLLKNWKLVLAATAIAAAGALYLLWSAERERAQRFREERDQAQEIAERNEEVARRIREYSAHKILELEERNEAVSAAKEKTRVIVKRIYLAPPAEDAPVAPVLRDAIERLYAPNADGGPH
jgi:Flp pilus assembly protein TadB